MAFRVEGVDVGVYDTTETHGGFYGYDSSADPGAQGLANRNLWVNGSETTAYVFFHKADDGSYALGLWFVEDTDTNEEYAQRTRIVDLQGNLARAGFVFEEGQGINVGAHGQHDFTYAEGDPVTDDGISGFAFEEGTGIGFENVGTVVEDEPQSFGGGASDDRYSVDDEDAVADHYYGNVPGDGVMWSVGGGNWSTEIQMESEGSDRDTSGASLPSRWYGVGPNGSVDGGGAGVGTSVSIEVDV